MTSRVECRAFGSFELSLGGDGQPTLQYQCNEEEVQGKLSQVFVKKVPGNKDSDWQVSEF